MVYIAITIACCVISHLQNSTSYFHAPLEILERLEWKLLFYYSMFSVLTLSPFLFCKVFHKTIIVYTDTFTMLTVEALVFKTPKQFQIDMILSRKYNTKQQEKCNKKLKVFDSQVSASKTWKASFWKGRHLAWLYSEITLKLFLWQDDPS